jgi:hypothetical protein
MVYGWAWQNVNASLLTSNALRRESFREYESDNVNMNQRIGYNKII